MKKRFTFLIAALMLLVFMMPTMAGWGQTRTEVADVMTATSFAATSTTYTDFSDVSFTSDAVYAGNSAKTSSGGIQLRSKYSNSGIVSTTSGGTIHSVAITVESGTGILDIYGKNTAYSSAGDLYGENKGTKIGSISATGTVDLDDYVDQFSYIGIRSNSGAIYLTNITVTWTTSGGGSQATATTTTIDASGITNTDIYTNTAAGSLSATVTAGGNVIPNAAITWSSNNTNVATINDSGAVTLVAAGTVTFKADYYGVSGTYQASYDEYEMTVTNSTPTVVDVLNCTWTGVTGSSSYSAWNNKAGSESDAVYAGNTARYTNNHSNAIQMRNTNSSGIVTTTSGGKVKKIEVTWNTGTSSSRTLSVYGKNTAYSGPGDLQNSNTRGTLIGSVTYNTSGTTTTVVNVNTDYEYVGLLAGGALYLDEIDITWLPNAVKTPTFSPAPGSYVGTQSVTISCETENATVYYTTDGTTPSASNGTQGTSVSISETTTLKAIAYFGEESSGIASGTFTIVQPLTTIQEVFDASNTSGNYYIEFNNWVVTGINTGGTSTRAYITDGEKGVCIYNNSGHGFSAGDKISGTIECLLNRSTGGGYAQINNITRTTVGLTVTNDGVATPANIALADLSGEHTGVLVSYNDLVYSSSGPTLSDGNTSVKPQGELTSLSECFIDGEKYHVTGIYINYTNYSGTLTRELCPRSGNDIVLAADLDIDASMTPFSYIFDNGPSAEQNIKVACTDLGTNTLTATASSDYEVSLAYDGTYTQSVELTPASGEVEGTVYVHLKAGLSVGEHNGTVTFTADNLTTMTVNLEGLVSNAQTYAIDLTQPTGGIATISSDVAVAEANKTITLSYSDVDDCYEFSEWSVMYELDSENYAITPDENNQFTMPAADVYVSAIFEQKTFTVNYSVNGTVYKALETTGIVCGSAVTLKTAADLTAAGITLPTGYSFTGWSTSAGSSETISSFTPDADATLYAVLIPSVSAGYVKVTSLQDITEGTYFIVNDGYVLPNADATNAGPVKSNDYKITTPLSDSYSNLPVVGTEWTFTGTNTAMTIKNSTTGHYLYVNGSNNNGLRVSTTSDTWSFAENGSGFSMKDASNNRYCATYKDGSDWRSYNSATAGNYGDGGVLYLYKKETPATYTRVEEITSTKTLSSIEPTYLITVEDGGVLTLEGPNNGTAENLIIKDGGQLKVYDNGSKDAVEATIEKEITGFGNNNNVTTGWNFIASPLTSAFAPDATMTSNTYDLYQLNNTKWENYKEHEGNAAAGFSLANGRGYLYANSTDVTLSFAGAIKPFTTANNGNKVQVSAGWNLIGNPYTFDVYVDQSYYSISQAQAGITANTDASNADAIKPCTSILVYAKSEGSVEFLENKPDASTGNHGNIQMTLAHNVATRDGNRVDAIDNAIVSFNEDAHLEKFYFGEPEANIYIPQNGRDYAIAFSNRQGDVPLNFKTNKISTYTISFEGEEMNLNGVYLIDMLEEEEIDLGTTPSYTFLGSPSDKAARFKIVFRNTGDDADSDIFAYQNGTDIIVSGEGELQIFDVMGRMVSSQRINGVETMCTSSLQNGVYVFRLNEKTQKIVVR